MLPVLSSGSAKKADQYLIERYGIPAIVLMENAARNAYSHISHWLQLYGESLFQKHILIFAGSGNNGGDGFALARHLLKGNTVEVFWIGDEEKMTPETRANFSAFLHLGGKVTKIGGVGDFSKIPEAADLCVDALLGVGGNEHPRGILKPLLEHLSRNFKPKYSISLDIPTGLNPSTGIAFDAAFRADLTITMGAIKTGLIINDGLECSGQIEIADLGVPDSIFRAFADYFLIEDADVLMQFPIRKRRSTKRDYGTVVVVGGAENMPGAPALAANAAITSGAGLVKVLTPSIHPQILPEVICCPLKLNSEGGIAYENKDRILEEIRRASAVVIGPGLGRSAESLQLVQEIVPVLKEWNIPTVLDADALRIVNANTALQLSPNFVLTPHLGEFCMLTGNEMSTVKTATLQISEEFVSQVGCSLLLKDVPSVVLAGGEKYLYLGGTPGMATAGSGDVLSGILAGIIAQGIPLPAAIYVATYIHGRAGELYSELIAQEPLTASRLIEFLPSVFKEIWAKRRGNGK